MPLARHVISVAPINELPLAHDRVTCAPSFDSPELTVRPRFGGISGHLTSWLREMGGG